MFCGSSSRCRTWVGLQCVIVVFPDHSHLLFENNIESEPLLENLTSFRAFQGLYSYLQGISSQIVIIKNFSRIFQGRYQIQGFFTTCMNHATPNLEASLVAVLI